MEHGSTLIRMKIKFYSEINKILSKSPIPNAKNGRYMIMKDFEGMRLYESEDIANVSEMAAMISELEEAWSIYTDHVGVDYATKARIRASSINLIREACRKDFEDCYQGEWDSKEAFAENWQKRQ